MSDRSPPPAIFIACLSILFLFAFPQISYSQSATGQLEHMTGQSIGRFQSSGTGSGRTGGTGSKSDTGSRGDTGPSQEELAARQRRQEANNLNDQGNYYFNKKRWRLALAYYKAALEKWPDKTIRENFENAKQHLAAQVAEQRSRRDAESQASMKEITQSMRGGKPTSELATALSGGKPTSELATVLSVPKVNLTPQGTSSIGNGGGAGVSALERLKNQQKPIQPPLSKHIEGFPTNAANLVNVMNKVSEDFTREGHPYKGLMKGDLAEGKQNKEELEDSNCRDFFEQVGKTMKTESGVNSLWGNLYSDRKHFPNADAIVEAIEREAGGGSGNWHKIIGTETEIWQKAQGLANLGVVVIGGYRAHPETGPHAHLAIVAPIPTQLNPANFDGRGPFVRDGCEHYKKDWEKAYPSTYGAVKASKAFPIDKTSWYIWVPSNKPGQQ